MSASCDAGLAAAPAGVGVTWPQLLQTLWISAAFYAALVAALAALDAVALALAAARDRRDARAGGGGGGATAWYAAPREASTLHDAALFLTHPGRSAAGRATEALAVAFALAQYLLWCALTYEGPPRDANAAILVSIGVISAFFVARQALRLAAAEPGRRARAALSLDHAVDALATAGILLTPFITGTWFSFAPLRIGTAVYV